MLSVIIPKIFFYICTRAGISYSVQWPGYRLDDRGSIPTATSTPVLENPASYTMHTWPSFRWYSDRDVELTTHLFLMLRRRMSERKPPFPHTSARRGSHTEDNFSFPVTIISYWCDIRATFEVLSTQLFSTFVKPVSRKNDSDVNKKDNQRLPSTRLEKDRSAYVISVSICKK
jgi:hypothetical protein